MCERVLDLPKEKLRLVTEDVGGGFGPKYPIYAEIDPDRLGHAQARPRPALDAASAPSSALADSHARDLVATADLGARQRGPLPSAVRVKAEANYGAYVSMFAPTIPTTGLAKVISGLYRIPAIRIDFDCVFSNTVPVDAIRGAGKPRRCSCWNASSTWPPTRPAARRSSCAGSTCCAPTRCLTPPPAATPTMPPTARGCSIRRCTVADEAGFAARRPRAKPHGKRRGLGFSCHLHGTGGIADEHVVVNVEPTG